MIEEHHCVHSDLDQKACEPLFSLVVNSAVERLESRTLLKTDLKDVIDTVSELFDALPTNNPQIQNSKNIIETYLNSDIELHSSIDSMLRAAIIPSINISSKKTNTSSTLQNIYPPLYIPDWYSYFRGVLQNILDKRKDNTSTNQK